MGNVKDQNIKKQKTISVKRNGIKCEKCLRKFQNNWRLSLHEQTVHGNKTRCPFCTKIFESKSQLAEHKLTHISQCKKCNCTLSSPGNLRHHEKSAHAQKRNFPCKLCPKKFKDLTCLNTHMKSHSSLRPYECRKCKLRFKYSNNLTCHEQTHTREKYFPCYVCEKIFTNPGNMKRHMIIHTGERPFVCNLCNASFQYKSHMEDHKERHENKRKYKCKICKKFYMTKGNIKQHMTVVHPPISAHCCDLCGSRFRSKTRLIEHIASHVGNHTHRCNYCGETFIQVKSLVVHKRKHTGYKLYQCDLCDDIFFKKKGVQKHKNLHILGKFLCCVKCKLRKGMKEKHKFVDKEELKAHMVIHRKEKRFKCTYCDFSTDRSEHMNRHKKYSHRKNDASCCKICHNFFPTKNSLKRHLVIHLPARPNTNEMELLL